MAPRGLSLSSDALHGEKVGIGTLLAIEEYKRLVATEPSFLDYTEFDRKTARHVFGEPAAEEIMKENENDAAKGITAKTLDAHWDEICVEIEKLPDVALLREIYSGFGVKSRLSDIKVDDEKCRDLLDFSPMVRNRFTLMRIRKAIK